MFNQPQAIVHGDKRELEALRRELLNGYAGARLDQKAGKYYLEVFNATTMEMVDIAKRFRVEYPVNREVARNGVPKRKVA